uniref:Transmembrane protein 267 n=1 Tax=Salmo trutta TaxID=8032 RepID=A0A673Z9U6_SALTR
ILPHRPPLHCSSPIPVLCFSLRLVLWLGRLKDSWCSLPWLLFISLASHHIRDGVRHGLWVCPFATLPHLCSVLMYLNGTRDVISTKHGIAIDV